MNLKRCSGCNKIIDVDDLQDVDLNEIVSCGLKEDDFDNCDAYMGENDPIECNQCDMRWAGLKQQ